MGAEFSERRAVGSDIKIAFRHAVERDQYLHGHGGYSGSLAEKSDYVSVELPARMTARRFVSLVLEAHDHDGASEASYADDVRYYRTATFRGAKGRLREAERDLKKARAARERFWKKVPAHAVHAVETAAEVSNDKWGPAVGVELRGAEATAAKRYAGVERKRGVRAFLFFGYCSS